MPQVDDPRTRDPVRVVDPMTIPQHEIDEIMGGTEEDGECCIYPEGMVLVPTYCGKPPGTWGRQLDPGVRAERCSECGKRRCIDCLANYWGKRGPYHE